MNIGIDAISSPQSLSDSGFSSLSDISPLLGSRKNSGDKPDEADDRGNAEEVESVDSVKSDIDNLQKKLQESVENLFKNKIKDGESDLKESSNIILTSLSSPESILDSPSNIYRIVKPLHEESSEVLPAVKYENNSENILDLGKIEPEVVRQMTIQNNVVTSVTSVTKDVTIVETQSVIIKPDIDEPKIKINPEENKDKPIQGNKSVQKDKQNFIKKSVYKVAGVIKLIFETIANFFKKIFKK